MLQWAQPFRSVSGAPGSATDFDILLLNPEHTIAYAASLDQDRGSDPVEILEFCNDLGTGETAFDLNHHPLAGGSADRMKYVYAGDVTPEEHHRQDGTVYGHANAAGAEAVGTAKYLETPAFDRDGRPFTTPALRRARRCQHHVLLCRPRARRGRLPELLWYLGGGPACRRGR